MARCLALGGLDSSGATLLIDGGPYSSSSGLACVSVALDPSEYQSWLSTSALLTGFDMPSAITMATAILGLWSFAWVLSFVRR